MRTQLLACAAIFMTCCLAGCCTTCSTGCGPAGFRGGLLRDLASCEGRGDCAVPMFPIPRQLNLCAEGSGGCRSSHGLCGGFGAPCGTRGCGLGVPCRKPGCGLLGASCGCGTGIFGGAGCKSGSCGSDCGCGCDNSGAFGSSQSAGLFGYRHAGGMSSDNYGSDCGDCYIGDHGDHSGHGSGIGLVGGWNGCGPNGCGHGGHAHGWGRGGLLGRRAHPYGGAKPHTPDFQGPHGNPAPQYAYPYYTTRGPRDFLMKNPPTIGW
ncbi:MAG TPA: hypothetical protein PKD64_01375 [Pirellulaceae bacterium]|nr:hypothetical protein [Pirellulaceae bacterium]HMO90821.1 hypothetical protein [Pirellulaceae bacterium]HMP68072.1 hypothetical protein [Pirellulaceae bacterium]